MEGEQEGGRRRGGERERVRQREGTKDGGGRGNKGANEESSSTACATVSQLTLSSDCTHYIICRKREQQQINNMNQKEVDKNQNMTVLHTRS